MNGDAILLRINPTSWARYYLLITQMKQEFEKIKSEEQTFQSQPLNDSKELLTIDFNIYFVHLSNLNFFF